MGHVPSCEGNDNCSACCKRLEACARASSANVQAAPRYEEDPDTYAGGVIYGTFVEDDGQMTWPEATQWLDEEDREIESDREEHIASPRRPVSPRQPVQNTSIVPATTTALALPNLVDVVKTSFPEGKVVRVFRFKTHGRYRSVEVRHRDCSWFLFVDDTAAGSLWHGTSARDLEKVHSLDFQIAEYAHETLVGIADREGQTLNACCRMRWSKQEFRWTYAVTVNAMPIPVYMDKTHGKKVQFAYVPDVANWDNNLYTFEEVAWSNYEYLCIQDPAADAKKPLKTNRVFQFSVDDELRSVEVAHQSDIWQIFVDGLQVKQLDHKTGLRLGNAILMKLKKNCESLVSRADADKLGSRHILGCDFPVKSRCGEALTALMKMEWDVVKFMWKYALVINGHFIPECGLLGDAFSPKDHYAISIPQVPIAPLAITDGPGSQVANWTSVDWSKQEQKHESQMRAQFGGLPSQLKASQVYHFTTCGKFRSVGVLHADCSWKLVVDGNVKLRMKHKNSMFSTLRHSAEFDIPMEDLEPLKANMQMEWKPWAARWKYTLTVHDLEIQPVYSVASAATSGIVEVINHPRRLGLQDVVLPARLALEDATPVPRNDAHSNLKSPRSQDATLVPPNDAYSNLKSPRSPRSQDAFLVPPNDAYSNLKSPRSPRSPRSQDAFLVPPDDAYSNLKSPRSPMSQDSCATTTAPSSPNHRSNGMLVPRSARSAVSGDTNIPSYYSQDAMFGFACSDGLVSM